MLDAFKRQVNAFQEADSDVSETCSDFDYTSQLLVQASEAVSVCLESGSGSSDASLGLS